MPATATLSAFEAEIRAHYAGDAWKGREKVVLCVVEKAALNGNDKNHHHILVEVAYQSVYHDLQDWQSLYVFANKPGEKVVYDWTGVYKAPTSSGQPLYSCHDLIEFKKDANRSHGQMVRYY